MAERVIRQLIDDLDGTEIPTDKGERIEFSIRGVSYQIDLSPTNANKLDKALKPFIDAGKRVRGSRRATASKGSPRGASSKEQLAAIRDWARKNGYGVADRGRISTDITEAFDAAH